MSRKYELIKSDIKEASKVRNCYRIRALKDFGEVKKGDLGGYIESIHNLSTEGDCWVSEGAMVCKDARVSGNAVIPKNERFDESIEIFTTRGYLLFRWYRNTVIYKRTRIPGSVFVILIPIVMIPYLGALMKYIVRSLLL